VIRGGENSYPRDLEEFLSQHKDGAEGQGVGVSEANVGEELCAWLTLRDGRNMSQENIRAFCSEQIAHYKVPRYIQFVEDFPMTVTGKAQKFKMRDIVETKLAKQEKSST
jgi:fatty-acyl-CoA synthase